MIKKVKTEQLKPGMYIHDMNCGWMEHPFFTNSMKVKNSRTIDKIIDHGIRDVYIDTDKGLDVPDAPTMEEVDREIQSEINKIAEEQPVESKSIPLEKELVKAKEIKKEAKKTVQSIMEEVRMGNQIRTEQAEKVVDKMVDSIFRNENALISLGRIKQTDEYTYMHSMSVCVLMIAFGKHLGFTTQELREAGLGAMLHDIGKMKIPNEILNNKGTLTERQYALMKQHVIFGQTQLQETEGISDLSVTIASQHHERVGGRGYPNALKGDEISLYGQAAGIVDVYDAMTSQRCYQRKYEPTEVLKKLYEWSDSYNFELVQQFIRCVGIYPVGTLVMLESGLLGVVLDNAKENLLQPAVRIVYDTRKSRHVMSSYDLDLSHNSSDRIAGYEIPERWNIKPEAYL